MEDSSSVKIGLWTLVILVGIVGSLYAFNFYSNRNFEKETQCVSLGEQYYTNYLTAQTHNEMFSFDIYDIDHQVGYSPELNTCLLYVGIKFKDTPTKVGLATNKFIMDLLSNKNLYFMAYGADNNGNLVVLKTASSFSTDQEVENKKDELFK